MTMKRIVRAIAVAAVAFGILAAGTAPVKLPDGIVAAPVSY